MKNFLAKFLIKKIGNLSVLRAMAKALNRIKQPYLTLIEISFFQGNQCSLTCEDPYIQVLKYSLHTHHIHTPPV